MQNRLPQPHSRQHGLSFASKRFFGPCGLLNCRQNPCTLSTHRAYMNRGHHTAAQPTATTSSTTTTTTTSDLDLTPIDPRLLPTSYLIETSTHYIERNFADILPAPHAETHYIPQFRELMHHYITDQVRRVSRIFAPQVDPLTRVRTALETIHSSPIFSVCVIANSQVDRVMQSRSYAPDRVMQTVYGLVLRVLREHIESFQPSDTTSLLLLVVALAGLEFCVNSPDGLAPHRAAMAKLVDMSGGINSVGYVSTFVLNTDRFIALCLGDYPLFKDPSIQVARPLQPIGKYGEAFSGLTGVIDPMVIEFSENQCRLVDMLETGEFDLTAVDGPNAQQAMGPNVLPHFLYLREKICADHANLHAYYHDHQVDPVDASSVARTFSISRCVMLGGHIAQYRPAFGDYYTIIRPMLGSELKYILERKPRSDWHGHTDIAIWLLFVLAVIPQWDEHHWTIAELRLWLSMKYGNSWPLGGWISEEAVQLRRFVWSDCAYSDEYKAVCKEVLELDRGLQALRREAESNADESDESSESADANPNASRSAPATAGGSPNNESESNSDSESESGSNGDGRGASTGADSADVDHRDT